MGKQVVNILGGTQEDPCPTAASRWTGTGYCNREDAKAWLQRASGFYKIALLPTWDIVRTTLPESPQRKLLHDRVNFFNAEYKLIPEPSTFNVSKNFDISVQTMDLMTHGEITLNMMVRALDDANVDAPEIPTPPTKQIDKPKPKGALGKYAVPAAVGAVGAGVIGLTVYLLVRKED